MGDWGRLGMVVVEEALNLIRDYFSNAYIYLSKIVIIIIVLAKFN